MISKAINLFYSAIADRVNFRLHVFPHKPEYALEGDVPQPGAYGRLRLLARGASRWFERLSGVRILRIRKISSVPWKVARKDTQDVLATIDYQRVVDLRAAMLRSHGGSDSEANSVNGAWKFLDIDLWIPVNLERIYRLELQSSPPRDILDISGGAGYFAYICQYFGHRVHTTDIDQWEEFNEMMEILSLERSVLWVEPMTPIPFYGRKFDLITSFMIAFNFPQVEEKRWGIEEWEFLLSDLEENHLKENGVIYLLMNPHPDRSHYSPELHDYLIRRGAEVEGPEVVFRRVAQA